MQMQMEMESTGWIQCKSYLSDDFVGILGSRITNNGDFNIVHCDVMGGQAPANHEPADVRRKTQTCAKGSGFRVNRVHRVHRVRTQGSPMDLAQSQT